MPQFIIIRIKNYFTEQGIQLNPVLRVNSTTQTIFEKLRLKRLWVCC